MIPKIIHHSWKSKSHIPENFSFWRASFIDLNPDFECILHDDYDNYQLVEAFSPSLLRIYNSFPKEIYRADFVRPLYLFIYGGFYADMDFQCLSSLVKYCSSEGPILGRMGDDQSFVHSIPNAMMASPPHHAFWLLYLARMSGAQEKYLEAAEKFFIYPDLLTGPGMLKQCVDLYEMDPLGSQKIIDAFLCKYGVLTGEHSFKNTELLLLPPKTWFPINWADPVQQAYRTQLLVQHVLHDTNELKALFPESDAVTFWTHSWEPPEQVLHTSISLDSLPDSFAKRCTLHIVTHAPGDTVQYVRDRMQIETQAGLLPVALSFNDDGSSVLSFKVLDSDVYGCNSEAYAITFRLDQAQALKQHIKFFEFETVHIHASKGVPVDVLLWLCEEHQYEITIHDDVWSCPRLNSALQTEQQSCDAPNVQACHTCRKVVEPHRSMASVDRRVTGDIEYYARGMVKLIAGAQAVYAQSPDVIVQMKSHGLDGNYQAMDQASPAGSVFNITRNIVPRPSDNGMYIVAVMGHMHESLTFLTLIACAEYAATQQLPLRFVLFGSTLHDALCSALPNVKVLGACADEQLENLVLQYRPHISFFSLSAPYSLNYAFRHCMRLSIWPVVSDLGLLARRVNESGFGSVYPSAATPHDLCALLIEAARKRCEHAEQVFVQGVQAEVLPESWDLTKFYTIRSAYLNAPGETQPQRSNVDFAPGPLGMFKTVLLDRYAKLKKIFH